MLGRRTELAEKLRKVTGIGRKVMVERQEWGEMRAFRGKVIVRKEEEALKFAAGWRDRGNAV